MDHSDPVELRLPSQLRFLSLVDAVVQSFVREYGWDPDDVNNLSTAVIEAVANGMEHGNRFAAGKSVVLRLFASDTHLVVEVDDEGAGFDARPFEREMTADDLLRPRGRGIYIMRSFVDAVAFERLAGRGMRVRLHKKAKRAGCHKDRVAGSA